MSTFEGIFKKGVKWIVRFKTGQFLSVRWKGDKRMMNMKEKFRKGIGAIFMMAVLLLSYVPIPVAANTVGTQAIYSKAGELLINETTFPDAAFRDFIKSRDGADKDGNGSLSEAEIQNCVHLSARSKKIASLAGVEYLTSLKTLDCHNNQLTKLDLSKNTALTELTCSSNKLTNLDLSKNTALTKLSCRDNQLRELNVTKNTALTDLLCHDNQLTGLDVTKNTALTRIYCHNNQLTKLDVSKNTALQLLHCYNNKLRELELSKNTALVTLNCKDNQLSSLDLSKNTALTGVQCGGNRYDIGKVSSFDLKNLPGNFDAAKASNWIGAKHTNGKLTDFAGNKIITYLYDMGNGRKETFTLTYVAQELPYQYWGDVDGKDGVTVYDALLILLHLADKQPITDTVGKIIANCDGKDGITVADALYILEVLADKRAKKLYDGPLQ